MAKPQAIHREPFRTGERVVIIRSRHGWFNGEREGVVISRTQNEHGTWSYVVRDDSGEKHDIRHTRDIARAA